MKHNNHISTIALKGIIVFFFAFILSPLTSLPVAYSGMADQSQNTFVLQAHADADATASCMNGNSNSSTATTQEDKDAQKAISTMIKTIIIVEKLILSLNAPIVFFIGKLMSNDWVYLNGDAQQALNTIWTIVRNFVNIFFAVILIYIAFRTVVGGGSEKNNFAVRTILPKFVFALIFVNFSLLAGRLILDMGNLATTAAFSIPSSVSGSLFGGGELEKHILCYDNSSSTSGTPSSGGTSSSQTCLPKTYFIGIGQTGKQQVCSAGQNYDGGIDQTKWNTGESFIIGPSVQKFDENTNVSDVFFDSRNAMYVYSYNIFRLGEILKVFDQNNPSVNLQDLTGIALNVVLAIIMAGMLILLNIAMLVAFAVRMVMIWVMLIFSPVMALEIIFKPMNINMPKIKGLEKGFLHTFVTLSFMPAVCGFILSIGLIMYTVLSKALQNMPNQQVLHLGGFKVFIGGNILPGFGSLQEVILALVVMIIIWTAIFAMLNTNTIVQQATSGFNKMGTTLAKAAGKGLTMIPIFPTGKGAPSLSFSTIGKVVSDLPGILDSHITQDANQLRKSLGLKYAGEVELSPKTLNDIRQLKDERSPEKQAQLIQTIFNESGIDNQDLANRTDFIEALKKIHGIDSAVIDKWRADPEDKSNQNALVEALKNTGHFDQHWNPPTASSVSSAQTSTGETTPKVTLKSDSQVTVGSQDITIHVNPNKATEWKRAGQGTPARITAVDQILSGIKLDDTGKSALKESLVQMADSAWKAFVDAGTKVPPPTTP